MVLYLGRLVFHAKAHPLPMYLALEEAARRSGKSVCLVQAGWFPNTAIEAEFKVRGQIYAPSVTTIYVDGRRPEYRQRLWHAADVFVSLADNIQETFGLSPIEAMAAGLPVVVSDWNGYHDTVRDGIDGFRVPTITAPAGTGGELALRYALGEDDYDRYIGTASLCTAVDVAECASAFGRLFASESLRRSMGAAGKERARDVFEWRHVVRAYQELWHELAQRRRLGVVPKKAQPADPLREDPFALFSSYPTAQVDGDSVVTRVGGDLERQLDQLYGMPMMNFALHFFGGQEESRQLLVTLEHGSRTVDELLTSSSPERRDVLMRTMIWLAKGGLLQIRVGRPPPGC